MVNTAVIRFLFILINFKLSVICKVLLSFIHVFLQVYALWAIVPASVEVATQKLRTRRAKFLTNFNF